MYALPGSACLMNPNVASRVMRNAATAANIAPADCRVHRPGLEARWPSWRGTQGSVTRHLYRSRCDSSTAVGPSFALNTDELPVSSRPMPDQNGTYWHGTGLSDLEAFRGFHLAPLIPGAQPTSAWSRRSRSPRRPAPRTRTATTRRRTRSGRSARRGPAAADVPFADAGAAARPACTADAPHHHRNRLHLAQRRFPRRVLTEGHARRRQILDVLAQPPCSMVKSR